VDIWGKLESAVESSRDWYILEVFALHLPLARTAAPAHVCHTADVLEVVLCGPLVGMERHAALCSAVIMVVVWGSGRGHKKEGSCHHQCRGEHHPMMHAQPLDKVARLLEEVLGWDDARSVTVSCKAWGAVGWGAVA
jgi:hypothetical protein